MNIYILVVIIGVCSATIVQHSQRQQELVDEECSSCATVPDLKKELEKLRLMIIQVDKLCKTQVNPCSKNPCLNGGKCTVSSSSYQCKCLNGYSGKDCQVNPCSKNPCLNGGTCTVSSSSYHCKCLNGYSGKDCQVETCSTNPCLNGGTCTDSSSGYQCKCLNGFSGKDCQVCAISANDWTLYDGKYYMFVENAINWNNAQVNTFRQINPCSKNPCLNGGTCTVSSSSYHCKCLNGYSGKDCQVETCSTNPCLNGGTCTDSSSGYQCKCLNGFSGKDCQVCAISANDWTLYDGKYYMFVENAINWNNAQQDCLSRGGRLAEVYSQNVGAWLRRQASRRGGSGWWVGASDLAQEGVWTWTSGNQVEYTDWAYREPNNGGWKTNQDCLQLWKEKSYRWDDLRCSDFRNYICQRKTCNSDD
ncbi:protein crumbs homolog 1-like [Mytilus californianus]|uniref:protein crumbs homolog 1-like n=1 Tax=Mytilus californianus TaxID=6549 RepID=UPI0022472C29|nr:protein crumbs homolog 1-like [Mytilus californianus]